MKESFSVWNDADNSSASAAEAQEDIDADEYVRLFANRQASHANSTPSIVIDLESEDDEAAAEVMPALPVDAELAAPSQTSITAALARFGHSSLRGLQEPALRNLFSGRDTVILLPTGGGKSLCFQLPAVMQPGLVVVISPLLALMQDQVLALRQHGIRVEMLCSLVSPRDKRKVLDQLMRDASFSNRSDSVELLYTTPETLPTEALQSALKALYRRKMLALFAIDEAHCISSWGHDFRPSYLKLGAIRDSYPEVPIMALTATATDRVRADIRYELKLRDDAKELLGDFNRPNISYTTCNKDGLGDDVGALLKFIQRCHYGSVGIVYVHRRLDTEALVEELQRRDENILAAPYHAEIPLKEREKTLLDWLAGKIDIICATIAFGMGIDHPAVRYVVHWNMPKSMENLYQESGRAGRDGHSSHHVLMHSWGEYERFQDLLRLAEEDLRAKERSGRPVNRKRVVTLKERLERLKKVMDWETLPRCRRQTVLKYFGQHVTQDHCAKTCDHCSASHKFESPSAREPPPRSQHIQIQTGRAKVQMATATKEISSDYGRELGTASANGGCAQVYWDAARGSRGWISQL